MVAVGEASGCGQRAAQPLEDHNLRRRAHAPRLRRAYVLDEPINRVAFKIYVAKVFVPGLRPGDVMIMDNLP